MRISRDSAVWKSAYAILCAASFDPNIDGEDLQDIADEHYGGDLDAAESASDMDPYCDACDSALEMCRCAKPQKKDEGEKPPVSDSCDDCGADVGACGCKDVARADMEPGPEMRQLLEMFSQEVYQKSLDELQYDELKQLRDILVSKNEEPVVYEI